MFKKIVLISVPLAAMALLAACSSDPRVSDTIGEPPVVNDSNLIELAWTPGVVENEIDFGKIGGPMVLNLTESSFTLVDGGSSSCPNVINSVVFNEDENNININYEGFPPGQACTLDYVMTASQVNLDSFSIPSVDDVTFTITKTDTEALNNVDVVRSEVEYYYVNS